MNKLHWFLICIDGVGKSQGKWTVNVGNSEKCVSKKCMIDSLNAVHKSRCIDKSDLVVTSVSYLGFMTNYEFNGELDENN